MGLWRTTVRQTDPLDGDQLFANLKLSFFTILTFMDSLDS